MLKRFLSGLLCLFTFVSVLPGCSPAQDNPSIGGSPPPSGVLPDADAMGDLYSRVDGAFMTMPLTQALIRQTNNLAPLEAELAAMHNGSEKALASFWEGDVDLLFLPELTEDQMTQLREKSVNYVVTPVATDALVFMVNPENPVADIARDRLQSIYAGTMTHWSDVGGDNRPITAFLRDESFVGQPYFEQMMGPVDSSDALTFWMATDHGQMVKTLSPYDNAPDSLGYSTAYLTGQGAAVPQSRLLSIDGVPPTRDNIVSGRYAFSYDIIALTRSDLTGPLQDLVAWLTGEEGQALVESAGYLPARAEVSHEN